MNKTTLSILVLGSFGLYTYYKTVALSLPPAPTAVVNTNTPANTDTTTDVTDTSALSQNLPSTTTTPVKTNPKPKPVTTTPTPVVVVPAPKPKGQYKDGSYTGPVVDAYYGNVQVQAVISGGRLVAVKFLDYPHDRSNSVLINSNATPALSQEAVSAQSANVDAVSGASFTSAAFKSSLAAALSQAKA